MENSDLTPAMQQMMAQMADIRAELDSLKQRSQALPLDQVVQGVTNSTETSTSIASTRRKTIKRLGAALLGGAVAATAIGVPAAQARLIANPALGSSTSKAGAIVVPLGASAPAGIAPSNSSYGLIASGGSVPLDLSGMPQFDVGIYGYGSNYGVYGKSLNSLASGVYGNSPDGYGVRGDTLTGIGVRGDSSSGSGVYGNS